MCAHQIPPEKDQPTPRTWIEVSEFFELALSTKRLWRVDEPKDGVVGLVDRDSGEHYCICAELLHASDAIARTSN